MKKLYLLIMVIVLTAVMVVPTGGIFAAPPPLDNHQSIPVSGTYEVVSWPADPSTMIIDWSNGDYIWPDNILTSEMHGDLEGTYVVNVTYTGNIYDQHDYAWTGTESFQGTLMGRRLNYQAEVVGEGTFTDPLPPEGFAGTESSVSTIVSADSPFSHLRGVINFAGTFDEFADPPIQNYSYSGELVWQTGKKH